MASEESPCVFCRIAIGELPAVMVYADDLVLAFLDIAPLNPGHALVLPKEHHYSITSVPAVTSGRLLQVAAAVGAAVMHAVSADGFNLLLANGPVAGQTVPHTHIHVVPRFPHDGLVLHQRTRAYANEPERQMVAQKIRARLIRLCPGPEPAVPCPEPASAGRAAGHEK